MNTHETDAAILARCHADADAALAGVQVYDPEMTKALRILGCVTRPYWGPPLVFTAHIGERAIGAWHDLQRLVTGRR